MRGKGYSCFFVYKSEGITPAYAGKSRDRPICQTDVEGSPPPMRGKGYYVAKRQIVPRITPAYAGKSSRSR